MRFVGLTLMAICLSTSAHGQTVDVPNVVGKLTNEAKTDLEEVGLLLGRQIRTPPCAAPKPNFLVNDQNPRSGGNPVPVGSSVDVFLSSPETTKMPNFSGKACKALVDFKREHGMSGSTILNSDVINIGPIEENCVTVIEYTLVDVQGTEPGAPVCSGLEDFSTCQKYRRFIKDGVYQNGKCVYF